jgi:hypothetical protein
MKKFIKTVLAITFTLLFTVLIAKPLSAQSSQEPAKTPPASLPADVAKVVMSSCAHCHMEPGNTMALAKLNFSKWDSYDSGKQASKAAGMNKKLSKGKMPPKGYIKDHPDKAPTDAEKKVISDWAKSLQPAEK